MSTLAIALAAILFVLVVSGIVAAMILTRKTPYSPSGPQIGTVNLNDPWTYSATITPTKVPSNVTDVVYTLATTSQVPGPTPFNIGLFYGANNTSLAIVVDYSDGTWIDINANIPIGQASNISVSMPAGGLSALIVKVNNQPMTGSYINVNTPTSATPIPAGNTIIYHQPVPNYAVPSFSVGGYTFSDESIHN